MYSDIGLLARNASAVSASRVPSSIATFSSASSFPKGECDEGRAISVRSFEVIVQLLQHAHARVQRVAVVHPFQGSKWDSALPRHLNQRQVAGAHNFANASHLARE